MDRLTQLHRVCLTRVPDPKQIKLDAWRCKKYCVFIKRKVNRGQQSRCLEFRELMNVLRGVED